MEARVNPPAVVVLSIGGSGTTIVSFIVGR
jgi:hypothetical protein